MPQHAVCCDAQHYASPETEFVARPNHFYYKTDHEPPLTKSGHAPHGICGKTYDSRPRRHSGRFAVHELTRLMIDRSRTGVG